MSERTSIIFETRDNVSMSAVSVAMKKKCTTVKSMSKSLVI